MVTTVANWVKPDGSQLIGSFWKAMSLLVCLALSSTVITNQTARQIVIPVLLKTYVLLTGHVAPVPRMCSIEQNDELFVTLKLLLLNITVLAYFLVYGTQGIRSKH
jgi:succinate-acetate transporter protein